MIPRALKVALQQYINAFPTPAVMPGMSAQLCMGSISHHLCSIIGLASTQYTLLDHYYTSLQSSPTSVNQQLSLERLRFFRRSGALELLELFMDVAPEQIMHTHLDRALQHFVSLLAPARRSSSVSAHSISSMLKVSTELPISLLTLAAVTIRGHGLTYILCHGWML